MRSSTDQHFVALDHIRGVAAFMVVAWHFGHVTGSASLGTAPALAFLDEGHVGVALFMTLSGYLFAKLLDGKSVLVLPFLWNRLLRLAPLLVLMLTIEGVLQYMGGVSPADYGRRIITGFVLPVLPQGAWSITVELHFYLLLPFLLWLLRKWAPALALVIVASIAFRYGLYADGVDLKVVAFRSIIGRIDQFVLGILAFQYSRSLGNRTALFACITFLAGYSAFDVAGGYYHLQADVLWVVLPTFEGMCLGLMIAWYDRNPIRTALLSKPLQLAGEYSYSIYLLHFLYFRWAANLIHQNIMDISNFYVALPWTLAFFAMMMVVGRISYLHIEAPFLRYRKRYLIEPDACQPKCPPAAATSAFSRLG